MKQFKAGGEGGMVVVVGGGEVLVWGRKTIERIYLRVTGRRKEHICI